MLMKEKVVIWLTSHRWDRVNLMMQRRVSPSIDGTIGGVKLPIHQFA